MPSGRWRCRRGSADARRAELRDAAAEIVRGRAGRVGAAVLLDGGEAVVADCGERVAHAGDVEQPAPDRAEGAARDGGPEVAGTRMRIGGEVLEMQMLDPVGAAPDQARGIVARVERMAGVDAQPELLARTSVARRSISSSNST